MTAPLSEQRLAEIRTRASAAAPAPWETDLLPGPGGGIGVASEGELDLWVIPVQDLDPADAQFIAHARADVPALLTEVERLTARVAELESERHDTNTVLDGVVRALRTKQGAGITEAANELERQFIVTGDRLIHRTKLLGLLREWAAARTGGAL